MAPPGITRWRERADGQERGDVASSGGSVSSAFSGGKAALSRGTPRVQVLLCATGGSIVPFCLGGQVTPVPYAECECLVPRDAVNWAVFIGAGCGGPRRVVITFELCLELRGVCGERGCPPEFPPALRQPGTLPSALRWWIRLRSLQRLHERAKPSHRDLISIKAEIADGSRVSFIIAAVERPSRHDVRGAAILVPVGPTIDSRASRIAALAACRDACPVSAPRERCHACCLLDPRAFFAPSRSVAFAPALALGTWDASPSCTYRLLSAARALMNPLPICALSWGVADAVALAVYATPCTRARTALATSTGSTSTRSRRILELVQPEHDAATRRPGHSRQECQPSARAVARPPSLHRHHAPHATPSPRADATPRPPAQRSTHAGACPWGHPDPRHPGHCRTQPPRPLAPLRGPARARRAPSPAGALLAPPGSTQETSSPGPSNLPPGRRPACGGKLASTSFFERCLEDCSP